MSVQIRISLLWLFLAVGYEFHNLYHLSELYYGIDIRLPNVKGEVPLVLHLFRIAVEIITLFLSLLILYVRNKAFAWFAFAWAALLGILNLIHLGQTLYAELGDISQIGLLCFVFVANVFLVIESWKWVRGTVTAT